MSSKKRKLNDYNSHLLRVHKKVARIGIPQRVVIFKNGKWMDIPHNVLIVAKHGLQERRFIVEFKDTNRQYALDFLNMFQIDMQRGFQYPLGWINEEGNCCFPQIHNSNESIQHLELNKYMGDFYTTVNLTPGNNYKVVELEASGYRCRNDNKVDAFNMTSQGFLNLDGDTNKTLFLRKICSLDDLDIIEIEKCTSAYTKEKIDIFQKQIKITKEHRGNANVRYAWLTSSKGALSTMLTHGLRHCKATSTNSTYGIGVHFVPLESFTPSSHYFNMDENGKGYMILCRIIMGNMELLDYGSKQSCPSGEDFDSGVDDLQQPSNYIIWDMNVNTHVYPEYFVSFKVNIEGEGLFVAKEKLHNVCRGTTSKIPLEGSPKESNTANDNNQYSDFPKSHGKSPIASPYSRLPTSPWMPFPMLIAAISNMVPPNYMDSIANYYGLFNGGKLTKNDFVEYLRMVVGDNVLMKIISQLHFKVPLEGEPKARECQK